MLSLFTTYKFKIYQGTWKLMDFIYPPSCAGCDKAGEVFCPECFSKVLQVHQPLCPICGRINNQKGICDQCSASPPPFTAARSWAIFSEPLRHALHTFKYRSNIGFASYLAPILSSIVLENQWNPEVIIPVPLSKSHMKERGYNQAHILAYPLALFLGIPMQPNAVKRVKETSSQVILAREERFKNLADAFLGNPATLKNKKVLLVDDIVTTGATLNSCTKALLDAGASSVYCITVAQTTKTHQQTL